MRARTEAVQGQVARTEAVQGSGGENLLALLAQLALRPDVPVERHGGDPEVAAECGHRGVAVRHRGLGRDERIDHRTLVEQRDEALAHGDPPPPPSPSIAIRRSTWAARPT